MQINGLSTKERAYNGFTLLNELGPEGWRDLINVDNLYVGDIEECPITQVFGEYSIGLDAIGLEPYSEESVINGFDIPVNQGIDYSEEFEELTNEWYFLLTGKSRLG